MIENSKQSTPLKVCLDDAGTHNRAILDFFFAKLGKHVFRCVETQEQANVILIDYDFPPARKKFEEVYSQWGKPALVLSISEVSLDKAIWLAKPLTSRSLLDAAETLQKQIVDTNTDQSSSQVTEPPLDLPVPEPIEAQPAVETTLQRPPNRMASTPPPIPLVEKHELVSEPPASTADDYSNNKVANEEQEKSESLADLTDSPDAQPQHITQAAVQNQTEVETTESRIFNLCGDKPDIEANSDLKEFYTEDSFFLSSLKDAIRLARQCQQGVLLNFPQARIYVLPEIHRVFCGINIYEDEFLNLIKSCTVSEGGKMHILSTREIHELNDMISQQASALYDMEAFIWTSTLLSAQGGLPRTLDPKKAVGLKHWPSLTRLENFPHAMPIAAQWSAASMNAFDVAKSLNIPQRYVFSFYNATNSLGLIEQDPEKLITKKSVPRSKDAPRGLFSRLLKRLVGG
jgi:hypothetical protein